jgi:hypothetical protein
MIIDECLTKPKKTHPKNPSVKSMAPPAPRECNQPARSVLHRKQSAHRPALRIPCIAAHCIATSSQHIGPRIASCAAQRIALHPVQRSAPRECNQPARIGPRIANNPRTNNQPATHRKQSAHQQPTRHASPAAPAKARGFIKTLFFAHRPPHGAHLTHAVLHALRSTLRWFRLVRGTNFSKIQFIYIRIAILSCVRSSVGTEFENLALCPGFDSGRKFSDFFYFRHFLQS